MPKTEAGMKFENLNVSTVKKGSCTVSDLISKDGKTAIVFLRYYGCPLCQHDMIKYMENYSAIIEGGNELVVVLQSTPESIASQTDANFPFDIICDPDMTLYQFLEIGAMAPPAEGSEMPAPSPEIIKVFKAIENMGLKHGPNEGLEEQLPAYFVVDSALNITVAHYCENPFEIPEPEDFAKLFAI